MENIETLKVAFKKANTFFRFENRILSVLRSGGHTPRALARVTTSFGWKQARERRYRVLNNKLAA